MSALEKVAWWEVVVTLLSLAVVIALYPFMGHGATGGFGLLGFLGAGMFFLRRRGDEVIVDERDRQIERDATFVGFGAAWLGLLFSLIAIAIWHGYHGQDVSVFVLMWLIWLHFALCYGVKGMMALRAYRGDRRAAES